MLFLTRRDLEHQLVVHLQQHARRQVLFCERPLNIDHGDLDDVGRGALDGRVERRPFGDVASLPVVTVEVGQVATATEQGGRVLVAAGLFDGFVQVVAHPAEPGEVGLHLFFCFARADLELCRQAEGTESVREPVAHRLDPAAHVGGHLVDRHAESTRPDKAVEVLTGVEGLDQPRVAGQMCHDPHLDLAVVGRHQRLETRTHDKPLTDLSAGIGTDRDVLEVRLGGRQPSGRRDGLVEGGVHPSVVRDGLQQSVDRDLEPRGIAVRQKMFQERVPRLLEHREQRIGVGGVPGLGLLGLGHLEFVEQHDLQLLRRSQVDLLADHLVGRFRGLAHPRSES